MILLIVASIIIAIASLFVCIVCFPSTSGLGSSAKVTRYSTTSMSKNCVFDLCAQDSLAAAIHGTSRL